MRAFRTDILSKSSGSVEVPQGHSGKIKLPGL